VSASGRRPFAAEAAELVERTRKTQGLPEKITDPAVLRRVAALLQQEVRHGA
jgi:hypothetical protein